MEAKKAAGSIASISFDIIILAIVIIFVYKGAMAAYDFGFRVFMEEAVSEEPGQDITVTISEEDSVKDIAAMLEKEGLIKDSALFVIQEKLSSYKDEAKPGTYVLNTSMVAEDMLKIIAGAAEETEEELE